jgi:hypothetical protein
MAVRKRPEKGSKPHGGRRPGAGRRLDDPEGGRRILVTVRVSPATLRRLGLIAERTGKSVGKVIDDLVRDFPEWEDDAPESNHHNKQESYSLVQSVSTRTRANKERRPPSSNRSAMK